MGDQTGGTAKPVEDRSAHHQPSSDAQANRHSGVAAVVLARQSSGDDFSVAAICWVAPLSRRRLASLNPPLRLFAN
ncbi:MAG: hypothetical protein EPO03_04995 [Porticoccaceae bacterium]|jgi:hypothetical protein|nr:MAG: hypothetical protein EPO03_04995 [Porticoccaceae bacterium]